MKIYIDTDRQGVFDDQAYENTFFCDLVKHLENKGFEVITSKNRQPDEFVREANSQGCDVFILLLFKWGKKIYIEKRGGMSECLAGIIKFKAEKKGVEGLRIIAKHKDQKEIEPIFKSNMPSVAVTVFDGDGYCEKLNQVIYESLCEFCGVFDGACSNLTNPKIYSDIVEGLLEDGIIADPYFWDEMLKGKKNMDLDALRHVLKGYHLKLKK